MNDIPYYSVKAELSARLHQKYSSWRCSAHGGKFPEDGDAVIFPPGKQIRIRSIDPKDQHIHFLTIKGVGTRDVRSGAVIVPGEYPVQMTRTAFGLVLTAGGARVRPSAGEEDGELSVEAGALPLTPAAGTAPVQVRLSAAGRKIVCARHLLLCPGFPYRLTLSRSPEKELFFIPVAAEPITRDEEKEILAELTRITHAPTDELVFMLRVRVFGYSRIPSPLIEAVRAGIGEKLTRVAGRHVLLAPFYTELSRSALNLVRGGKASTPGELGRVLEVDRELVKALVAELSVDGSLTKEDGVLLASGKRSGKTAPSGSTPQDLSPAARQLLETLESRDREGIDLASPGMRESAPLARELVKRGYAVPLTAELLYAVGVYRKCVEELTRGGSSPHALTVQEAKERLGLSRKYVLPILDRIKRESTHKEDGHERKPYGRKT